MHGRNRQVELLPVTPETEYPAHLDLSADEKRVLWFVPVHIWVSAYAMNRDHTAAVTLEVASFTLEALAKRELLYSRGKGKHTTLYSLTMLGRMYQYDLTKDPQFVARAVERGWPIPDAFSVASPLVVDD